MGLSPLDPAGAPEPAAAGLLQWFTKTGGTCPSSAVGHGFLLDWSNPAAATTAQTNVASFLLTGAAADPTPVVVP
jgi:hypothetical protein